MIPLTTPLPTVADVTARWHEAYAVFGERLSAGNGKAVGVAYDPVAQRGEIRSLWPGVQWTDLALRGRVISLYAAENSDGTGRSVEVLKVDSTGVTVLGVHLDILALQRDVALLMSLRRS